MVHPCKHTLAGVDDNIIGCLTSHSNGAETEGAMLFHGVDIMLMVVTSTSHISHNLETMKTLLRGVGLKDDRDSIDNGQKENDDKINSDTNNQSPSQG
eukprot:4932335-Ditylum_brightwellii.AAC.1